MEYAVWRVDVSDKDTAWISFDFPDELSEVEPYICLGSSVTDRFPADIVVDLSSDHGTKLTDSVPNHHSLAFVSEKLKSILESCGEPFEFYPIKIRNQRQRIVKKPYYIANLLKTIPCLDKKKSEFRMGSILKDQVARFYRCVLDESRIPEGTNIFRLKERKRLILLTVPFAKEIKYDHKCTGVVFERLESHGKEFRDPVDEDE